MTPFGFILTSLRHYRRIHVAVALGVAVATAVLTGALLVGDSVRGSLRDLTLQRLGRIDTAVVAGHMFRATLVDELASNADFQRYFGGAESVILIPGTVQRGSGSDVRRATKISVIGCGPEFWKSGQGGPPIELKDDEVAITESVARELVAAVGDEIQLRIAVRGALPADSSLGKKDETSRMRPLRVAAILPPDGVARFGLAPSQLLPRNVFVPLSTLQNLVEQPEKANAILVSTGEANQLAGDEAQNALREALRPHLDDFGIRVEQLAGPNTCLQISADQLVLGSEVVRAAQQAFPDGNLQPIVTYLANTLSVGTGDAQRKIPYSTITGVDSTAELGPLLDDTGKPIVLADDEIVLNRWAADDLRTKPGDEVTVTFYEPESTHGRLHEHAPPPVFKLRAIGELTTADGKPTLAADPKLTPELPGVTDQKSIHDWDLPFDLVETIRPQDEDYWNTYRTTPKAFVSLAAAKRLWASRWGEISLLRMREDASAAADAISSLGETRPREAFDDADAKLQRATQLIADKLERAIRPADLGISILPLKSQGLAAASGTTPFQWLFLGFSFFLIAAALMLITLLFQLGMQQRSAELGTLAAVGIVRPTIARLLSREGLAVAIVGAAVGVVAGVGYAWLMIAGLRTWWVAAISTPFLELHVTWLSLVLGWVIGVLVSWLTIRWSIRRLTRVPAGRLLAGSTDAPSPLPPRQAGRSKWRTVLLIVLAASIVVLMFLAKDQKGEVQAGLFFATGAALLTWMLVAIHVRMQRSGRASKRALFGLLSLALLNMARNPGRSTLTVGLVAAAGFLILAVSAFRLDTGHGGTGGCALTATSDRPIYYDLNSAVGRRELGFAGDAERKLEGWHIISFRVAAGEDASCLNLYQPRQPRMLGVPQAFIDRGGFDWAAADTGKIGGTASNPWQLLNVELGRDATGEPIVPVVLDASTAIYSLHLGGVGSQLPVRDAANRNITLQVVGLLANSVLQGNLLVSEENLLSLFPSTAGYEFFLIAESGERGSPAIGGRGGDAAAIAKLLESTLAGDGFDATDAREQLASFLAVQNTYLSTFQSLGVLGLLLGTIGIAVVQLRSVLERRGELALMRATGFAPRRLMTMVAIENALLLLGGLAVGGGAAAVATMPQWAPHGASVPWATLAAVVGAIAVVGLVASWLTTRSVLRAPLVAALRGD